MRSTAAELALAVGRLDEALELLDGARGRSDDPRLRAHGERIRARVEMLRGSPQAAHDRLVAIAEAVAEIDRPLAAAAMTEAVLARTVTGPVPAYRETAERAFALAEGLGGEVEAMAAVALGCGLLLSAETDAGLELFARYGAVVEKPEVWHSAPELPGMYACLHASIERFDTADRLFTAMTTSAREQGAVRALPYPLSGRALVDLELGRWPAALAGAEEAVELSREMAGPAMLASSLAALAQVEASMGRPQATRAHAEESLAICKQLNAWAVEPEPVLALASLALSLGEHEDAVSVWTQTTVDIREWVLEPGWEHLDDVMIEASVRAGRTAQAERELADLEAKAQRTGRTWAHAVAARCRGLLASTGELDEHFQRALEWHERAPLPFARARTELCYGERLRRARRRSDAREQLARASATFHALGAKIWAERAERELAAAGYSRQSPAEQSPWAELTAAETRVARVIIEGATYDEAASRAVRQPPDDRDAPAPDLPQGWRSLAQRDDPPAGYARRRLGSRNIRVFPDAARSATRNYALVRRGRWTESNRGPLDRNQSGATSGTWRGGVITLRAGGAAPGGRARRSGGLWLRRPSGATLMVKCTSGVHLTINVATLMTIRLAHIHGRHATDEGRQPHPASAPPLAVSCAGWTMSPTVPVRRSPAR